MMISMQLQTLSADIFTGGNKMIATNTSDIIYLTIALIIMFVSGYIFGTTDEMGRENKRKEKRRRKQEQEQREG